MDNHLPNEMELRLYARSSAVNRSGKDYRTPKFQEDEGGDGGA